MACISSSLVAIFSVFLVLGVASAKLSPNYYDSSCPNALSTIKSAVEDLLFKEAQTGADFLRLHFHDCFVNGCDASVLLDDTPTFTGEKTAKPNNNSLGGFDEIDIIKSKVESICPGVVSCADIVAVAARDSVVALGGLPWTVQLGRRDSTTASFSTANTDLPSPASNLSDLIFSFSNKGFTMEEMVALSGAHTIGQARCLNFRARIYGEKNIDRSFASSLKSSCPATGGDENLSPLDKISKRTFDNAYYKDLLSLKGLLHSDQQLYNGGSADFQVITYGANSSAFLFDFANAILKMGDLGPLTGTDGEIRNNCRKTNH